MKLGASFSDSLIIESSKTPSRLPKEGEVSWWQGAGRAMFLTAIFTFFFFLLILRLFDLTIMRGFRYRQLADANRIREITRHAPRGILYDRTGKPVARNEALYRLIKPCENTGQECNPLISHDEGEKLQAEGLPKGWFLEQVYRRIYPYQGALAHLVGYLGQLSEEELKNNYYALRGYQPGDALGRLGAEMAFEERLRGKDGKEMLEVDASGQIIRTLGIQKEIPGEDLYLSVDGQLAKVAGENFPLGKQGAVVVSKPGTGEILAMYSSPSFNPDLFSTALSQEQYQNLFASPDLPLFNRAIGGAYPPGSVFKIVTALAALEEKAISKSTLVEDTGEITIGPFKFGNWYFNQYGKTEGSVDILKALQRSNDIFFYKTGEWLGISKLAAWAKKVGIGRILGIEISGEATGLIPDPAWKNKRFTTPEDLDKRNNEWYLGDTYHVAIGQGYLLTTPLQVNAWTNIVANAGKLCPPTILKNSKNSCKDLNMQKETLKLIQEGMKRACEPGGTGWPLFDFKVKDKPVLVACKTGTAEFGDPNNRTHAWFTVFAPIEDPEISVTVLVEAGGEGSSIAAPIAKKILEEWFGR